MTFREALAEQRWDDHRYYHHSRINQSLHLISAVAFLTSYGLLVVKPGLAALIGCCWRCRHDRPDTSFSNPRDTIMRTKRRTNKESIKVGYNLRRKVVLLSIWICSPLLLGVEPTLFGLLTPHQTGIAFVENVSLMWLAIGIGAVLFRTVQLLYLRDLQAGLVWFTKIVTDPFHDVKLYHRSPVYLMRGELYDPIVSSPGADPEGEPAPSLAAPVV